jgi:hypothetical protein
MKSILLLYIFCVLYFFNISAQSNSTPTFFAGPTFHLNIGNEEHNISFGLEASAWLLNSDFNLPPSADIGIEFEKGKFRVYSELQTGALIGLSAGPVVEFSKEDPRFGFQSSIWAAFILGFDFRYRRINNTNYFCPGSFIKVPLNFDKSFAGF